MNAHRRSVQRALAILLALAAVGGISPIVNAAPPPADTLLRDSFETGEESPEGWEQGPPVPSVRYLWSGGKVPDGKRALSLKKTANRYFPPAGWTRKLDRPAEQGTLEVRVQVKTRRVTKSIVDVQFLDQAGQWSHEWACYIGAKETDDPSVTHDWKEYTGKVAIPPRTQEIAIALQIYGPGQVWFDELEITSIAATASSAAHADPQPTAADHPSSNPSTRTIEVHPGAEGQYLLIEPTTDAGENGHGLVVVLAGGDGSADFHPFVRRIQEVVLAGSYLVAQPIAKKWKPDQQVVWPTGALRTTGMKFTTEELVAKVIDDVAKQHPLDRDRVYLLAWSSGGPAAYATLMDSNSPAVGGLIAMSVYKPETLPDVSGARNKRFYLLHSEADRVCPYRMAEAAVNELRQAGAKVTLATYEGGHGWHGDVFGNIRRGIEWLDRNR